MHHHQHQHWAFSVSSRARVMLWQRRACHAYLTRLDPILKLGSFNDGAVSTQHFPHRVHAFSCAPFQLLSTSTIRRRAQTAPCTGSRDGTSVCTCLCMYVKLRPSSSSYVPPTRSRRTLSKSGASWSRQTATGTKSLFAGRINLETETPSPLRGKRLRTLDDFLNITTEASFSRRDGGPSN